MTGRRERAAFGKVALIIAILAVPAHAAGDQAGTVPPGKAETTYGANRLQAGVLRRARRYELSAAVQYVHFGGLPTGAIGPGPLGLGAVYSTLGLRLDVHRIGVATARDHWYFGSGATQARGTMFGFATRPANGGTDLGTAVEVSADYALSPYWSINGFLGVFRGGQIVRRTFSGRTLTFGNVENVVQF